MRVSLVRRAPKLTSFVPSIEYYKSGTSKVVGTEQGKRLLNFKIILADEL